MNNATLHNVVTVSVFDTNSDRQAQNLNIAQLADAVTPWFSDWADADIRQAISQLNEPAKRAAAAAYLGLDLRLAA